MSTTTPLQIHALERRMTAGRAASLAFDLPAQPGRPGWLARVTTSDGHDLTLSKLDGETQWTVDACWAPNGLPMWAMGFGSRCTAPTRPTADLAARLDALITEGQGREAVAWGRPETDPCERGTPGCSVRHTRDSKCETW